MTEATDELVRQVSAIPQELNAAACFGTPIEHDSRTLIPVARVNFGYGLGFGGGTSSSANPDGEEGAKEEGGGGGGGGGGGSATPVAVIHVEGDNVRIEAIEDKTRLSLAGMTMIAWVSFWALLTARTIVRERSKALRRSEG